MMKLLPLELAVWIRSFAARPFQPQKPMQPQRFWIYVVVVLSVELAIALWIMGAVRPLSAL